MWQAIQAAITTIGAGIGYFCGGIDGLLTTLIILIIVDYITGVMVAIVDHDLSSEIGFKGICRKVLMIVFVGIANLLDVNIICQGQMLRTAVIFFYISNEGISITENAVKLGLPVPQKIVDVLKQIKTKSDDDKNDKDDKKGDDQK